MELHKAIFKGRINKRRFELECDSYWTSNHFSRDYYIKEYFDTDYEEIATCEFDRPPLADEEKIHIAKLDKIVTVTESIRSTNGGYIYHTNYVIKTVEDDETIKSRERAENRLQEINKEKEEVKIEYESATKKKWYQFWK